MKKTILLFSLPAALLLGQEKATTFERKVLTNGPLPQVMFFANGNAEEAIKGSPYSAETITESVQVLADGNRITRTNKTSFARDSEGRTRRDSTFQHFGTLGQSNEEFSTTYIQDPVAQVAYSLDSRNKIAIKTKLPESGPRRIARTMSGKTATTIEKDVTINMAVSGGIAQQEIQVIRLDRASAAKNAKTESLGERNIEGLVAKGTKTTVTIPAGEQGNERPIEVVTETWYSEQLKAAVLTKHNDPRFGETTTRMANLKLTEPPRSLFEPPSDYKLEENMHMRMPEPATTIIREEI
jgi:hypothetical protein